MLNQQLLDFIKQQLSKGVEKETITKELLGSGWTQTDINEGFNTVNTPIINLTTNPVVNSTINPVASTNINNPNVPVRLVHLDTRDQILAQTVSHLGKKLLLIIIVLFIIAGGVSGYYFRNDIPLIKDLIKSKAIPINEIKQTGDTQTQTQPEQVSGTIVNSTDQIANNTILPEKDCGISKDTPETEAGWESSYKGDPALKCFGESALSCTNAKVIITGGNFLDKNPALLQIINSNGACLFKYTGYQKKYTQCPLSLVKELDVDKSNLEGDNPILIFKNINTNNPEKYTASLFNSMIMMSLIDDIQYQKNGCTGDLYKTMSALRNKARGNSIKSEINSTISNSRAYAELYFDKNQENNLGYTGVCLNELELLTDKLNKYSKVSCYDTVNSYAISASYLDGYICADNTGFSGDITKNITGSSCR